MISVYAKNRPWSGHPRCDFIHVVTEVPLQLEGYRIDGEKLSIEPTPDGYLKQYWGWYHPATAWEIEEFRRLGGGICQGS